MDAIHLLGNGPHIAPEEASNGDARGRGYGAKTIKRYSSPATPSDRLMEDDTITAQTKEELSEYRPRLAPVALLRSIREAQSALAAISTPEPQEAASCESLERFLARLPTGLYAF